MKCGRLVGGISELLQGVGPSNDLISAPGLLSRADVAALAATAAAAKVPRLNPEEAAGGEGGNIFPMLGLCSIKALRACEATNIVNELGVEANRELLPAQGVAKESAALELSSPTKRLSDSSALSVVGKEVSQAWKFGYSEGSTLELDASATFAGGRNSCPQLETGRRRAPANDGKLRRNVEPRTLSPLTPSWALRCGDDDKDSERAHRCSGHTSKLRRGLRRRRR
eukprot:CAMPEP_0171848804 /NCGR_PEP_ID=MMETSP0992-20121227/19260_1 /TAXON_ID=483369 /ORGANISM="non described non described, Strain CCMP2098" /LENGTH=225 /DNA_ID=CAMNT_0012467815 /DNA_START=678 /DNA_END=1356 /DNA_ORIENTATION=-